MTTWRLDRWTTLCLLLCFTLSNGCAISTTYGKGPTPAPAQDGAYTFQVFKNAFETDAGADKTAEKEIRKFLQKTGANDYELVSIDRHNEWTNKDTYVFKPLRRSEPDPAGFEERAGRLTGEVLIHVDIPKAGIVIVNEETNKKFGAVADKEGWLMFRLPPGNYVFGALTAPAKDLSIESFELHLQLQVRRTDGVTYAGHVQIMAPPTKQVSTRLDEARSHLQKSQPSWSIVETLPLTPYDDSPTGRATTDLNVVPNIIVVPAK